MDTTHLETLVPPQQLQMTSEVLAQIRNTIGLMPAEQGGILGGNRETGEVTRFYFDKNAKERSRSFYTPNIKKLNRIIKHQWKSQAVELIGFVHSHPPGFTRPSEGDREYAWRILEELYLPYLLTPIVTTIPDTNNFCLYAYAAVPIEDRVEFIKQELIVDNRVVDFEQQEQKEKEEPNEFGLIVNAIDELLTASELATTGIKNLTLASLAVLETAQTLYWRDTLKNNRRQNNG